MNSKTMIFLKPEALFLLGGLVIWVIFEFYFTEGFVTSQLGKWLVYPPGEPFPEQLDPYFRRLYLQMVYLKLIGTMSFLAFCYLIFDKFIPLNFTLSLIHFLLTFSGILIILLLNNYIFPPSTDIYMGGDAEFTQREVAFYLFINQYVIIGFILFVIGQIFFLINLLRFFWR